MTYFVFLYALFQNMKPFPILHNPFLIKNFVGDRSRLHVENCLGC